jgi:hypothetical protein
MAERHAIGMLLLDRGPRADEARERLVAAMPGAGVTEPDAVGVFEVALEAESQEDALQRV